MAKTVTEFRLTRGVAFAEDSETATRLYHVHESDIVGSPLTPTSAILTGGIPAVGNGFPDKPGLVVINHHADFVEGHNDLVLVAVFYRNKDIDLGNVFFDANTSEFFDKAWRDGNVTIPALGTVTNSNTDDIGGTHIDVAGAPLSIMRCQTELQVTEIVRNAEMDLSGKQAFLGKRNSVAFFSFAPGLLVYRGARTTGKLGDDKVQLTHRFVGDSLYHLQQTPKLNQSGIAVLDANKTAAAVYWRQPFPNTANFGLLSVNF